jgi:hypothetical protein
MGKLLVVDPGGFHRKKNFGINISHRFNPLETGLKPGIVVWEGFPGFNLPTQIFEKDSIGTY